MKLPLVTIGIPTFNRADSYLKGAIESALSQTYEHLEVIVSDNGSTDHTQQIVASINDPRLKYVLQPVNLGQRGNMNFLVDEARGDYFLMYHDDDRIDPDFVETCMRAADFKPGTGLIVTGSRVIDDKGNVVRSKENPASGLSNEEFMLLWFKRGIHMFFCNCIFGIEALRKTGGFQEKYGTFDDVAAEFLCMDYGGRIDVMAVKAGMREHPDSGTSSTALENWCKSALILLELAISLAPSKEDELRRFGLRTSAFRNYRYASESSSITNRVKGYWMVYRYFRILPDRTWALKLFPQMQRTSGTNRAINTADAIK